MAYQAVEAVDSSQVRAGLGLACLLLCKVVGTAQVWELMCTLCRGAVCFELQATLLTSLRGTAATSLNS